MSRFNIRRLVSNCPDHASRQDDQLSRPHGLTIDRDTLWVVNQHGIFHYDHNGNRISPQCIHLIQSDPDIEPRPATPMALALNHSQGFVVSSNGSRAASLC